MGEKLADLEYQPGFGNHFSSEAIAGALPRDQNSPLVCPLGLYAEQISGTSFTSPRKLNQRSMTGGGAEVADWGGGGCGAGH
ncbi:hypothetical protein F2Q69_00019648 [Brassica cretica]|uniref:homogentisate 1,2-dioxygenase n=1 Tax=Brassica cretica TaxID=69181 RepID=A0A8S9QF50_BRACR|nr:hypothetical protein F2Q69_00019648 [Brassica cretica]